MVDYNCAAKDLCREPQMGPANSRHKCINCDFPTHMSCFIELGEQNRLAEFVFVPRHFSNAGQVRMIGQENTHALLLCILCAKNIKEHVMSVPAKFAEGDRVFINAFDGHANKNRVFEGTVRGVAHDNTGQRMYDIGFMGTDCPDGPFVESVVKAVVSVSVRNAKRLPGTSDRLSDVPQAPRKLQKKKKIPATILRDLRRTAAVYAQCFISGCTQRTSDRVKFDRIEEEFYGNTATDKVGSLKQIVAGGSPFDSLFKENTTADGKELILKELVCGESHSYFVAGADFTVDILSRVHYNNPLKRLGGRAIWDSANEVCRNIKKALSIVNKLDGKIANLEGDQVVGYASGHNESNFFRYVLDGMFVLELEEKRIAATPITVTDDIETISANESSTVEDISANEPSTVADAVQGLGGVVTNVENTLPIGDGGGENEVDGDAGEDADDEESQSITVGTPSGNARGYLNDKDNDWDPWKGIAAPDGWFFPGWMAFVCLGPTSSCPQILLKMHGYKATGEKSNKSNGRKHMLTNIRLSEDKARDAGGRERGISLQTKVSLAAVAQGEDDADMRDQDRELAVITSQINSHKEIMLMYSGFATASSDPLAKAGYMEKALTNEEKILELTEKLRDIATRKRKRNPIVLKVLDHAAKSLGLESTIDD